jgi:MFS family permease
LKEQESLKKFKYFFLYVASFNFFCWLPVFFLFFNFHVGSSEVLWLESIYYFSVTFWEVPSGYFSDYLGRKKTLYFASGSLVAAYLLFCFSSSFEGLAVAQILLGAAFALNSGTDASLLYESLEQEGNKDAYPELQAKSDQISLISTAIAVIIGGLVAAYDIRLPYALSAFAAVIAFYAVYKLPDPISTQKTTNSFIKQLKSCFSLALSNPLGWIFLFSASMTILNHIVYEFAQPYLKNVSQIDQDREIFWVLAFLTATGMFAGGKATALWGAKLARGGKLATASYLFFMHIVSMIIVTLPAGLWGCLAIVLRGIPSGISGTVINSWSAPLVPHSVRATYLSLQSLLGRLSFAFILLSMGSMVSSDTLAHNEIVALISGPLYSSAVCWVLIRIFTAYKRKTT